METWRPPLRGAEGAELGRQGPGWTMNAVRVAEQLCRPGLRVCRRGHGGRGKAIGVGKGP